MALLDGRFDDAGMAKAVSPRNATRPRSQMKAWRKARGLTQDELAEKVGLGVASISQIETGKQWVSEEVLHKIADALEVTIDELLRREGRAVDMEYARQRDEILKIFDALPDPFRQTYLDQMRALRAGAQSQSPAAAAPAKGSQARK